MQIRVNFPNRILSLLWFVLIFLIAVPGLFWHLKVIPAPWFDEGYKTNAAWTLARTGVFGTYTTEGLQPFDPGISSGPFEISLVAISFKIFGQGILQGRLVMVGIAIFGLIGFFLLGRSVFGNSAAWLALLALVCMPPFSGVNYLLMGRQVMAEVPALALILWGWWLWYVGWRDKRIPLLCCSGIFIGLGLLSKSQMSIALLPAFGIACLAIQLDVVSKLPRGRFLRLLRFHKIDWKMWLPLIVLGLILLGWIVFFRFLIPSNIQKLNSTMLWDSIYTNLVVGFLGSHLTSSSWLTAAFMLASVAVGIFFSIQHHHQDPLTAFGLWFRIGLYSFIFLDILWFIFFSNGWIRYAFPGICFAVLALGEPSWDCLTYLTYRLNNYFHWIKPVPIIVLTSMAVFMIGAWMNGRWLLLNDGADNVTKMAQFIDHVVPETSVIESWEWEIDALTNHLEYHHPPQQYLFTAIRQTYIDKETFQLSYDALNADPDFLLLGPFSIWTKIYDENMIEDKFQFLDQIGPYSLYERKR